MEKNNWFFLKSNIQSSRWRCMLQIVTRSSTKSRSGNSPPVQAEVEISNMEVDGIDHVSLFNFLVCCFYCQPNSFHCNNARSYNYNCRYM